MTLRIPCILLALISLVIADDKCIVSRFENVNEATQSCSDLVLSDLQVPGGKTLELDLLDGAVLTFSGNITFGLAHWSGPLLQVKGNGITVRGEEGHVLYGQGELYWDGIGSFGTTKPKFFFVEATNALFEHIHIYHSPMHTVYIKNSNNVTFSHFFIDNAAGDIGVAEYGKEGHNTDGFGVGSSHNIIIKDSTVYNQDDCVVLNSGTNILVTNMLCHGSHGLSLSVGTSSTSYEKNTVSDSVIENSVIIDAMTGIHIKTHIDAPEGIIKNVTYRNIFMIGSYQLGISIEQNYTNTLTPGEGAEPNKNIPIVDLTFENIKGTVLNTSTPYYIVCAEDGCIDWNWSNIAVYGIKESACVNYHPNVIDCVDYNR